MRPAPCCPKQDTPEFDPNADTQPGNDSLTGFSDAGTVVDTLLENRRRLEHHNAPRRNWHFLAGLGITADALAFLAHDERTERGKLHGFAALKTVGDLFEHQLHQCSGFRA